MDEIDWKYAEVALPVPLRRTFTYRLPAGFCSEVCEGSRVLVPFGRSMQTGFVTELLAEPNDDLSIDESSIKDIQELIDERPLITPEILRLTKWASDYYAASWGEMLKASLPAGVNAANQRIIMINDTGREAIAAIGSRTSIANEILRFLDENGETPQSELETHFGEKQAKRGIRDLIKRELASIFNRPKAGVRPKLRKSVSLIATIDEAFLDKLKPKQASVVRSLSAHDGEMLFTDLLKDSGSSAASIAALTKSGAVEVSVREVRRDPLMNAELPAAERFELNADQAAAFEQISEAVSSNNYKAFLLHGITGSGKTEVYIRAMQTAVKLGRSALMLVPEIALTPIFSRRLRAVFGDGVAILHSNLSAGERFDEWRRIRSGEARIVIGTRSAVFAPLENIGIVIVDEEHDASYRQNEAPFYNARDTAVMRASMADAVVVLGSATPALETFQNAQNGKYEYLRLEKRIGDRKLAIAELVDMREVFRKAGKDTPLSPQLIEAIRETHANGQQSIILLNRRGFSQFVLCRTCGESLRCPNCDISLTYHRTRKRLICHYCSHSAPVPDVCPFCDGEFLYFIGEGTEQLESILEQTFPGLRIARIDRDTMSRRGELAKTLIAFDRGEIDMLVGTQILAKGHDFQNVTLVGVISVDTGLGLPDFRSAERTFQLLTQVAGRAGRGELSGRVLIQTYYPEHYALRHAVKQDFEGFFREEIKYRQRMNYPPFVVLASILIKHSDQARAMKSAQILKAALDDLNPERSSRILGVAPASLSRLKGEYRFQILIKSPSRRMLRALLNSALQAAETRGCDLKMVQVEIDPVNLM